MISSTEVFLKYHNKYINIQQVYYKNYSDKYIDI